jgi:hypothetical protein
MLTQDDLIEWAEMKADKDPYFRHILRLAGSSRAPGLYEHLLVAYLQDGNDPLNPPRFSVPDVPGQGISLGNMLDGDKVAGLLNLPEKAFSALTLLTGASGTGKSMVTASGIVAPFIKSGKRVIVCDPEDQYHLLLCPQFPPERLLAFRLTGHTTDVFRMNPPLPPRKLDADQWKNIFASIIRRRYQMGDGMENLLRDCLSWAYSNYSVPVMSHVKRRLDGLHFKPTERHYAYKESLQNRLNRLMDTFACMFDCSEGYKLDRSVIFRVRGLEPNDMGFFEDLFVERLKYEESELSDELKILLVFEEAHSRFSDPYSRIAASEPVGFTHMRTLRKLGIGQLYVDQVPSLLPAQLLANTATFVVFRLVNPNCIRRIGDSMGLSPEQREAVASLPNRRAVVFSHLC